MIGNLVRQFLRLFTRASKAQVPAPPDAKGGVRGADLQLQSTWLQSAIRDVSALTESVGTNVGQHNERIAAVSRELEDVLKKEPSVVVAVATRMLAANEELQARLTTAERLLQDYSRQLSEALASARTDALTGLLNRRALDDALQRCVADNKREGRPASLLVLDVDDFKSFNDRFGHQAGDEVLKQVAQGLRQQARETDIIARYGGEEFVVVLTSTTAEAVRRRAEQIRAAVSQKEFVVGGQATSITASAGLSELLPDQTSAEWLKNADEALYAAKRDGRNCAYVKVVGGTVRLTATASRLPAASCGPALRTGSEPQASYAFAPELLEDESFVRRLDALIAQWKRGGPTLTVLLARLHPAAQGGSLDAPIADFVAAAEELAPADSRITRWQPDGVALLMPDTNQQDARRFARQLCEAFGGVTNPASWFQLGLAEGQEGNTALRILERAAIALAACSGPFEIRLHDGLKAVPVHASPPVRRTKLNDDDAAPTQASAAM